ncbi:MAG: PD-(D/E)XK nuclease family protein, partial [Thermoanaerobaculia bacterium]
PWPGPDELRAILRGRAEALLAEEGVTLPGLARALAATALPLVEAAGRIDWAIDPEEDAGADAGGPSVLAAEVEGSLAVADAAGRTRELRFRADRVDRVSGRRAATLRLTDYKTGRPISDRKLETTRRSHFLQDVQAGRRLQAVAYALAAAGGGLGGPDALGRYLFLRPDLAPEHREFEVWARSVPFADAFRSAVAAAIEAWDWGAFFPRLVEPDRDQEPSRCRFCDVHEACLRGDSGARRRLGSWAAARTQPSLEEALSPAEVALLRLWTLPSKESS